VYQYVETVANSGNDFFKGDLIMRKVLLATTALVAISVTAAQADISIGGTAEFEMYNPDSGSQTFKPDGSLVVTASNTTDSGMTIKAVVDRKFEGSDTSGSMDAASDLVTEISSDTNDAYIEIGGDFGTIRMGSTDDALDRNDGSTGQTMTNGPLVTTSLAYTALGGDKTAISYETPSINGLKVYGSVQADGAYTGAGIKYSIGGVNFYGQQTSVGASDKDGTSVGASFSAGGITFGMASTQRTDKTKANDIGATYSMGEIEMTATSGRGTKGSDKDSYTSISAVYTVAPGLKVIAETAQTKKNAVSSNYTWANVVVSF
jgi:hypothetical protein